MKESKPGVLNSRSSNFIGRLDKKKKRRSESGGEEGTVKEREKRRYY